MKKDFSPEMPLKFSVHGNEISGYLSGSSKLWKFHSESPYFKSFYNEGVAMKQTLFFHELDDKKSDEIFDAIVLAGEKMKIALL